MSDIDLHELERRQARTEWEIEALRNKVQQQEDRVTTLMQRMDAHHGEVMAAIGSLKDDRARQQGRQEERMANVERQRDRMKLASLVLAILGMMLGLGWIGSATTNGDEPVPPLRQEEEIPS